MITHLENGALDKTKHVQDMFIFHLVLIISLLEEGIGDKHTKKVLHFRLEE